MQFCISNSKPNIMKTPIPLKLRSIFTWTSLFAIVFFMSCTQDTGTDPLQGGDDLKATTAKSSNANKVAKSIYGRLSNFADPNQQEEDILICNPQEFLFPLTRNILSGHMTHLGKLQTGISDPDTGEMISGSFGAPLACDLNTETFDITSVYEVTYVAANGDTFKTLEQVTIKFPNAGVGDFTTGTFEGTEGSEHAIKIIEGSGTGRFDGASGYMDFMNGQFGPESTTWEVVGEIVY
jgi:hypothetical protein